jgi:catechol 2,3-dioxygenase-like lactoylglutathione lyase family enzyme
MSKKNKAVKFRVSQRVGVAAAAGVIAIAAASISLARPSARTRSADDGGSGKVLGMAFDGHQVSNLDNSIRFYEALDFKVQSKTDWKVDKIVNALGGTKGAESRTAVMLTQSSVSDKPFPLILREYRGIERKDWSGLSSSDLLSGHMDLTVQGDCNPVMDKLKSLGLLKVPNMNLPGGGGGSNGPRRFVFLQDPDGWFIELFAIIPPAPGTPPAEPKVSNSTATAANIDRLGKQTGFNHIGLNVVDPTKALAFYQGVLGGDYPPLAPPAPAPAAGAASPAGGRAAAGPRMTMMNGWFSQATTNGHVRLELIAFPQKPGTEPPDEHFADVNVNYVGFQVSDLDAVYAKAKAAGAITVSDGIVKVKDGRAVMLRDPDVGGFVELWEPSK